MRYVLTDKPGSTTDQNSYLHQLSRMNYRLDCAGRARYCVPLYLEQKIRIIRFAQGLRSLKIAIYCFTDPHAIRRKQYSLALLQGPGPKQASSILQ